MKINFFKIINIIIISSIFTFCHNEITKQEVTINFIINSKIKTSYTSELFIIQNKNEVSYYYSDSANYIDTYFTKIVLETKMNILYLDNTICNRIGEVSYNVNDKKIQVDIYKYDVDNVDDEEYIFFFNKKYGIFLKYSSHWYTLITYRKPEELSIIIDKIIDENSHIHHQNL